MPALSSSRFRAVSSRHNSQVKELREAFTQGQLVNGVCAVEGVRLIEEAIRSSLKVRTLFIRESAQSKAGRIVEQVSKHADVILLPDSVFDNAVGTESPQGIAALIRIREHDREAILAAAPTLLVVAAAVQDPGNLGTLIRSAEAFGAAAVLATEGTASFWNAKTVRASAGSVFRLPVAKTTGIQLLSLLRERQIRSLALVAPHEQTTSMDADGHSPGTARSLADADFVRPCALFIGNEGAGLSRELMRGIEEFVSIPQIRVESLNAGVAASIALYEARRQRRASQ